MSGDNNTINNVLPRVSVLVDANDVHDHQGQHAICTIHPSVAAELNTVDEEQDEYGHPLETIGIERCIVSERQKRKQILRQAAKEPKKRAWWKLEPDDIYFGDEEAPCGFCLCLRFFVLATFVVIGLIFYVVIPPPLQPTPSAAPASPIYEMQLEFPVSTIPEIHFQHARIFTPQDGIEMEQDCRMACTEAVAFVFITEHSPEFNSIEALNEINCICYRERSFSMCNHNNSDVPFRSALLSSTVPLSEESCEKDTRHQSA